MAGRRMRKGVCSLFAFPADAAGRLRVSEGEPGERGWRESPAKRPSGREEGLERQRRRQARPQRRGAPAAGRPPEL